MNLIFIYLIIGHLVGDFLFQTSRLVEYKQRNIYGIVLHCLIIWFSQSLLLLPYLFSLKVWLTVTLISLLHFVIDFTKIKLKNKTNVRLPIIPFTIDQILHFSVLYFAYLLLKNELPLLFKNSWWFESLYQNQALLIYFSGVIFFSYALDIVFLTFKLQKNKHYKYQRGYFDMLLRVALFALIYTLLFPLFS